MKSVNGSRCRSTSAGEPALELLLWISAELIGITFPGNRMRWVKIYLWWMSQDADSRLWQWVLYNVVRPELVCLSHHTPGRPLLCRVSWFHSTAGGNREGVQVKTHRALFWEKEPGRKARKAPEKQLKNVLWNAESPNRLAGCWAGPDYREDVWLMDCSPSELAFERGLANRLHCHMYRDSLPDAHTIPGHISPPTHTLTLLPPRFLAKGVTHTHWKGCRSSYDFTRAAVGGGQGGTGDPSFVWESSWTRCTVHF